MEFLGLCKILLISLRMSFSPKDIQIFDTTRSYAHACTPKNLYSFL